MVQGVLLKLGVRTNHALLKCRSDSVDLGEAQDSSQAPGGAPGADPCPTF